MSKTETMRLMLNDMAPKVYSVRECGWWYGIDKKFTQSYEDALAYLNMTEKEYQEQKNNYNSDIQGFWYYDIVTYDTNELLDKLLQEHEQMIITEKGNEIAESANNMIEARANDKARKKYNQFARRIADILEEQQCLEWGWEKGTKIKH